MAGGKAVQIDKLTIGDSPRYTAIQAATLVRKGDGVLVAVTITGAAGAVIDLWEGSTGGTNLFHGPATLGPGTYWIYQSFTGDLIMTIATAVTDMIVITAGI